MTKEKLLERLESISGIEVLLDDIVHDLKSEEASAINNGGVEDQLEYILSCMSMDSFMAMLGK